MGQYIISIHTLHTEGDELLAVQPFPQGKFNHTLHTEGDLKMPLGNKRIGQISIHTLHTEGDEY